MIYIYGKSLSGKSKYAESLVCKLAKEKELKKIYIATMLACNEESIDRIKRHREQRKNLDFYTIEAYKDLSKLKDIDKNSIILLECMANYVANNKFEIKENVNDKILEEKLYLDIVSLNDKVAKLIVVGNDIYSFENEESFDEETKDYIKLMKNLHKRLILKAESFIEIINGEVFRYK